MQTACASGIIKALVSLESRVHVICITSTLGVYGTYFSCASRIRLLADVLTLCKTLSSTLALFVRANQALTDAHAPVTPTCSL